MAFTKDISFRIDSIMDISQINKALSQVQKGLSGLKLPQNLNNDIKNTINNLTQELDEFRQLSEKDLTSMKDIKNVTSSYQKIVNYYKKLGEYVKKIDNKDLKDLIPDSAIQNINKAANALKEYETQVEDTQKSINSLNKEIDKQQKALNATSEKRSKLAAENITLGSQKSNTNKQIKATERQLKDLYEQQKKVAKGSVEYKQLSNQIDILQTNLKKLNKAYNDATATIDKNKVAISGYNEEIKQTKSSISSLTQESQKLKATGIDQPFEQLRQKIAEVKGVDISEIPEDFNKLKNIIDSLTSEELDKIRTQVEQIKTSSNDASPAVRKIGDAIDSVAAEARELDRINREISNLTSQVEYFFGIENTIELFKRGIRQAFESVKELDKAMTDTAVVTDFSVGDMWEALPRYTAAANELGTTTLGAYETMTLYYQQGLKTNEVFEIGTETMKMARIAGMDYTKATDLMTAALRGFNMELNQTSAQRINDVYSELAAITAADTEEIADAMTRTASIASSAGMEFETTSAFLSQMIETTREAPENLGTAMKTIIARFQELKKAPSEIASEIDGEAINVNKIDAALKSIGVSLMDNVTGQFRELDDVFLEIAGKWDGLDKNTQRYIATVAAGSRQQSRFIAMMSNYDRTMELVDAANNSAGASQRQFEKTTESLESKLNKLKNAWNEFTRNLANSAVIKGVVDILTTLLNVVNKILNTMPGAISMIVSFVGVTKGLGVTRKVLQALITTFAELIKVSGTSAKVSFLDNLINQFTGTGKKASVVGAILENFKTKLGKKGVAGAAADSVSALQALQVGGTAAGAGMTSAGAGATTTAAGFTAALGPILAVVAAIGAVIAIGYTLWSTTQETERELKRVSEAANDAADRTNTLKDAISKLEEKQQEMKDIDSSFDTLVEGTAEWNSKLIESNSLISEIIAQFPEMAQYLKTIDGRMQFDEAGWDEVNKRLEERLQTVSNLQASLTAKQGALSAKAAIENTNISTGIDGVSEEQKIKIAEIFATRPATTDYNIEQLRTLLENKGIIGENVGDNVLTDLLASADELASAFNNYTIASDSENTIIRSLLEGNLNTAGITGSAATAAANIASKSYKPEKVSDWWFKNGADEDQTRKWAEQMGYRIDSWSGKGQGVKYTDLATGETGEISNEEVLVQFNELEAQEKATKVAEEVANSLTIDNKEFAESFKKATASALESGDLDIKTGKALENVNLSEVFSGILSGDALVDRNLIEAIVGDKADLESAIDGMLNGLSNDEKAERIANYLGKDIEEVKKNIPKYTTELVSVLKKSAKNIDKVQKQRDNKLRGMIAKTRGITPEDAKRYQENPSLALGDDDLLGIEDDINALTEEQKQFLVGVGDKIISNLGEEALTPFIEGMQEIYSSNNEAQIGKVTEYIDKIDFSNPIQATKDLKLGVESDIDALSTMSQKLLEAGDSSLNASAQFQYLYQQESFSEIAEEIDKMVLKEGKIDGAGVLELTSKSSDLKDMIDNTGISVDTLGDTFTALSKGDIALSDLTAGVMAALSAFDQLDGVIQNTSDFVSNLDLGPDTGKFAEDIHSKVEEIIGMYEAGEYGNPQIENLIKQLFGEDRWNEALGKAKGNFQIAASQFMDELRLIDDNLYSVWASFDQKNQQRLDKYNQENKTELQISQLKDGTMDLEIGQASTEQVVEGIMEAYQVTKEYAELMLTDFANNSAELRSRLAENDWTAGIQEYLKNNKMTTYTGPGEEKKDKTEESFINANDITTLSKVTGKDEIEYWRQLADELKIPIDGLKTIQQIKDEIGKKRTVIDFDTTDIDQVKSFFAKTYSFKFDETTTVEDLKKVEGLVDGTVLNLNKVKETLSSLGVPPEVISQIQSDLAKIWEGEEGGKKREVKIEGATLDAAKVADDIESATEEAAKQADYTAMGEALADALSGIEVKYDTSTFKENNDDATEDLKTKTSSAISTGTSAGIKAANKEWENWNLKNKSATVTVTPKLKKNIISFTTSADGKSVTLSANKEGTDRSGLPKKQTALVGEVGPELVENQDGTATLYGVNGPTIANLNKGAIVHNAQDTKKILRGNDNFKTINRYENERRGATGYVKPSSQKGPLGSKGGTSDKTTEEIKKSTDKNTKETKKNTDSTDENTKKLNEATKPLDRLYNTLRYIDKELRMVNKYQERYERLLDNVDLTGKDLIKNLQKQTKQYNLIIERSTYGRTTRQNQIKNRLDKKVTWEYEARVKDKDGGTKDVTRKKTSKKDLDYWLNYNKKTNLVTVDQKRLNKLRNSKVGSDRALYNHIVDEILPKLEGWQSDIEEMNDNIEDANNALEDMKKIGKESLRNIEDRVYQALVQREQKKIDKLSQIDDSINSANQDMINTIQDNLSKIRQDRQNQETEEDIAAKERRLAYLRRDTSNANAVEIKQLEEELANQKQDYTDTLIDQKVSELQEQNELASEERQQQIDLLTAQLKYDEENGAFWEKAHTLMEEGIDEAGRLVETSELVDLLKSEEGFAGLSVIGQMDWYQELQREAAQASVYMENIANSLNKIADSLLYAVQTGEVEVGEKVTWNKDEGSMGKGGSFSGTVMEDGETLYYEGKKNDNVHFEIPLSLLHRNDDGTWDFKDDGNSYSLDDFRKFDIKNESSGKTKKKQTIYAKGKNGLVKIETTRQPDGTLRGPKGTVYRDVVQGTNGKFYTEKAMQMLEEQNSSIKRKYSAFKTGGIADFTGPAWLDGTKTKPEMVLNARDTENFIQLKDILKNLLNQQNSYNNSEGGDNYYEIQINVEKLESDYDVDRVAEKVKRIIVQDSKYRNVNVVNRLR